MKRVVAFKTEEDRQGKLIEKQLLPYITAHLRPNGQTHRETYCFASNKDLCFGITVIPFQSSGAQGSTATEGGAGVEAIQAGSSENEGDGGLAQDLRKMLADPNNFSDVVLETKDGMDISAHKFILAARSPVMKQLIQEESFGGTIPIDFDVNPIQIILQWMYTGKLTSEATGPVIEEVVLVAEKYELVEMLKQLDKEMISACNMETCSNCSRLPKRMGCLCNGADHRVYQRKYLMLKPSAVTSPPHGFSN
ncbi:Protein maternal effect lethal 26 [Orchesella cincta]|uniref:Protein maternal effect lethal 26 n=1 Tax=Orchesella cincta TaxID=48709 RepID=A0A1D2M9M6_ORCCI|nr:Protein maternal effect lethal 26 [Orchesella cincta]